MTAVPAAKKRYTIAEYLAMEEKAVDKHEYHAGEILAMSGGSVRHSLIAANVVGETPSRLKGSGCRVFESNLRVAVARSARYFYPDASIVCGEPAIDENDPQATTITNPRVVIEVLSDSTEAYDRGEKFGHYRLLDSLQEYVLVAQTTPSVEVYTRQGDGTWIFTASRGLDASATLRSVGVALPLAEVYAGIDWPQDPASPEAASA